MVAIEPHSDVDIHNIAILQWPAVRDAVADALVDAGADALGEGRVAVAQRRRVRPLSHRHLVHDLVDLLRGDARRDHVAGHREDPRREVAGRPHLLDALQRRRLPESAAQRCQLLGEAAWGGLFGVERGDAEALLERVPLLTGTRLVMRCWAP